jgi:hypothetical protein
MLFDLRGRRRRAVQATYLMLALLMGGGLVLFGIGGEVSGGLFNAFEDSGGGSDNSAIEERIDQQEERLAASPQNVAVLQSLIRDHYQLATTQQASGALEFPDDAKDELRQAGQYWQRYVDAVDGDPSPATALFALRVYDTGALDRPGEAAKAARIIANDQNDSASYLQLVQYAALGGDTRTADLAAQKAIDLAPKGERKAVKEQAEALKQPPQAQQPGG